MNDLEKTKHILNSKYRIEIFNVINDYFQETKDAFNYVVDYWYDSWYELCLRDYFIQELHYVVVNNKKLLDIVVDVDIEILDIYDLGMQQNITEKLRIEANTDRNNENFVVDCVGFYMASYC